MGNTYTSLFNFSKVVGGVGIELHHSERSVRDNLLGDQLGGIQKVEAETKHVSLIHDLGLELGDCQQKALSIDIKGLADLVFRVVAIGDRIVQILAVVVTVLTSSGLSFIPHQTGNTLLGLPAVANHLGSAIGSDEAEAVDSVAVHVAERTRNTVTRHQPQGTVEGSALLAEEVPSGSVCSSGLGDLIVGHGLDGVDKIGELDGVLDEEGGEIDTDDV